MSEIHHRPMSRDERILERVERCAAVRPCVLKGFYVEDGQIHILMFMLDQHDENGKLIRKRETIRLAIPASDRNARRQRAL
jgi:hypothetical protein